MCHMYLRDWDAAKESLDQALALNRHQQTYTVLGRWGPITVRSSSRDIMLTSHWPGSTS